MIRVAILVTALVFAVGAQAQGMKGMQHGAGEQGSAHKANGTVTKVDREKSRVTIKHGAVATLEWPAMTMTFAVKDRKLMEKLQPGKPVQFQFAQQGKDYVITGVQ